MFSHPSSRAATGTERRAAASARQRRSTPTTSLPEQDAQEDEAFLRKLTSHTAALELRTEDHLSTTRTTTTTRTRTPFKAADHASELRKSKDALKAASAASGSKKEQRDAQVVWSPTATLMPHTTAPLACRMSVPPMAVHAPRALQPQSFSGLSLEAQELALVEDLLFVFMGFEGQYVRYTDAYQPLEEKSRLIGPQFHILPGLDPSLADLAHSMLKMATHYAAVEAFVEVQSRGRVWGRQSCIVCCNAEVAQGLSHTHRAT